MIIRKKTIFLISLVILLVVVGYINHQLTIQSSKQSSTEYKAHEEGLLEIYNPNINNSIETSNESMISENTPQIEIIDSKQNEISELTTEANSDIEEIITKEENRKRSNYFIEYRLSRDKLRATLIERLNDIIYNGNTTEEIRTQAQKRIISIGDISEKELNIEGQIKAKGFDDALVFIKEDSARVVVSIDELTEQDVMKILNIVMEETSLEASNIVIMEKF